MKKYKPYISIILIWMNMVCIGAEKKGTCSKCVKIENCPTFASMTIQEQQMWLQQNPCDKSQVKEMSITFVFSLIEKGDYICCPDSNIRVSEHDDGSNSHKLSNLKNKLNSMEKSITNPIIQKIFTNLPNNRSNHDNSQDTTYGNSETINPGPYYPNQETQQLSEKPTPNLLQNPYFIQKPNSYPQEQSAYLNDGNTNMFGAANSNVQCTVQTSLPPNPATGCCGRDMSDSYSITDLQNILNIFAPPIQYTGTYQQQRGYRSVPHNSRRKRRHAENDDFMLDDRIAGGKETELDQYPWTALLNIIFAIGNQQASFSCGGSLISPKYVLTAGHCVFSNDAKIIDIEVTLAEYDKRTFPRDCANIGIGLEETRKCITNVLMHAKNVIIHPHYNDDRLYNDIALIELDGYAPFTRFIRPICLPSINIENLAFSNLAVTGWGRNGQYNTDVKQSTVVHLVPHDECELSYPRLSNTQVCAAGRTGEDTCQGDSGGPLMMLYGGNYYLVGVVSGKRADSPCGSRVPSLYTNVYHYVPWIRSVIGS